MPKITFELKEELDEEFRKMIADKRGFRRGALQESLEEAIVAWIIENKKKGEKK